MLCDSLPVGPVTFYSNKLLHDSERKYRTDHIKKSDFLTDGRFEWISGLA
jgi:hypothetical protein